MLYHIVFDAAWKAYLLRCLLCKTRVGCFYHSGTAVSMAQIAKKSNVAFETPQVIPTLREKIQEVVLHCFGYASEDGTSTAVFKRRATISQRLFTSKARLSKRGLSISRLELVACLISSNQMWNTIAALSQSSVLRRVTWSDSTVALHWIFGEGSYKQFVRNGVCKIREKPGIEWGHVSSNENTSDIRSQGCYAHKLLK